MYGDSMNSAAMRTTVPLLLSLAIVACCGHEPDEMGGVDLIDYPGDRPGESRKPEPPVASPLLERGITFAGKSGFSVEPTAEGAVMAVPAGEHGERLSAYYSLTGTKCEVRDGDKKLLATVIGTNSRLEITGNAGGKFVLARQGAGFAFTNDEGLVLSTIAKHSEEWRVLDPDERDLGNVTVQDGVTRVRRVNEGDELTTQGRIGGSAAACLVLRLDPELKIALMLRIHADK